MVRRRGRPERIVQGEGGHHRRGEGSGGDDRAELHAAGVEEAWQAAKRQMTKNPLFPDEL